MSLDQQPVVLEADVPLSQSIIWRMQQEFYGQRGLKVWAEDRVPNFITNNPFFAETYARIVAGFFEDCENGLPLRILELGAGTGKFCYLFLRELTRILRTKTLSLDSVRYCMTDCVPISLEQWRANVYLAEFVAQGILEFELLDATGLIDPVFLNQAARGPLVVIANYVFDSLPQDAFVIKDGRISEVVVTTRSPSLAAGEKFGLSRLQFSYKNIPLISPRYPEHSWNDILNSYTKHLPDSTVLFPVQVLRALQQLRRLTDGRMLVLAADKGHAHEDALALSQGPPAFEFHASNCFSMMVNFDAIARYFQAVGGSALLPDKHFSSLNICGFLNLRSGDEFPRTRAAYQEAQSALGADDLFTLFAWLNAHMEEMSVAQVLAALRLTRWDPLAFMRLFPVLARQLRTISAERNDLRTAVMRTWANHYPIGFNENEIAFQCGVVLLELRFFEDAVLMFHASQRIFAPSAATSYNLGLCYVGLDRRSDALQCMIEACSLDPTFEPARLSRAKMEREAKTNHV